MNESFTHVTDLANVKTNKPTFLAIGVFDGVHRGHQRLLRSMVTAAAAASARPAVLTFYPHPISVINGRKGRLYLCTMEERIALLAELGIELVIAQSFNESFRQTRAANFVNQLCGQLSLDQLWGGSFGLGYNREGDLPFLQEMGADKGFSVHLYEAMVEWHGQQVSSSRVRHSLSAGSMDDVSGCLGRPYRLAGTVIHGDGRGRALGIPTANLQVWDELILPAPGVYAAYAWFANRRYLAATNVGYRPTVNGTHLSVEAHLLDFDQDIYGQTITLEFIDRIRDEKKFSGLDALVSQIKNDIDNVRQRLHLDKDIR